MLCIFFYSSHHPRDLHSFPTRRSSDLDDPSPRQGVRVETVHEVVVEEVARPVDRKSTRLNSSHVSISYAVFCLKKKTVPLVASLRHPPQVVHTPVRFAALPRPALAAVA